MKKLIAIFAVSGLVMLSGCCKSRYQSAYVYNFVAACVSDGAGDLGYCSCLMDVIQEKMSQKDFIDEDAKISAGKKSDKLAKVLQEDGKIKCAK